MTDTFRPSGVAGISPREPVGASLSISRRARPNALPIEKDRFHLLEPHERDGMKHFHPDFRFFNGYARPDDESKLGDAERAAYEAEVAKRRVVSGVIAHGSWDYRESGCLEQHLSAYRLPKRDLHPSKVPTCIGDGVTARRFFGEKGVDDFRTITCPNEECPFRKPVSEKEGPPCRPLTRFLFRLDWQGTAGEGKAPTPIVRLVSNSFYTFSAIAGLKKSLDDAARALGVDPRIVSPFGLRFRLMVSVRTQAAKPGERYGRKFPVVIASLVESAPDFILRSLQTKRDLAALAASVPTLAIGGPDYEADIRSITVNP